MKIPAHKLKDILDSLPDPNNYYNDKYLAVWLPEVKLTQTYAPEAVTEAHELLFIKVRGYYGWQWELHV